MAKQPFDILDAYTVVFDGLTHLGPGDPATTQNLAARLRPDLPPRPRVADFGCGAGTSALTLARSLPGARVLALDAHAPFIARLQAAARAGGFEQRISAVVGDMLDPPALDGVTGEYDLIWCESAIYSVGRPIALTCWRPLLRPGGWLVFSDVVWRREPSGRSDEALAFWGEEYPAIANPEAVLDELAAAGLSPLDPVSPGRKAWSNYYEPLRERLRVLAKRTDRPQALSDLMAELRREIDVYDLAGDEVAATFFIARRDSVPD